MDVLFNENSITYIDQRGNKIDCDILCNLESKDRNYIIYTDNKILKDGTKKIYASSYVVDDNNRILESIKTDEEWNMIESILLYLTKEN